MRKSHTKQLLLTAMFGPLGVLYTSTAASLVLTLSTLTALIIWPDNKLLVAAVSIASAALAGCSLALLHNRKSQIRNYSCSTYIGRVSCKVTGPTKFKRDYGKPLAIARRNNVLRKAGVWSVTCLCGLVSALIVFPDMLAFFEKNAGSARPKAVSAKQALPIHHTLPDTEIWQVAADTEAEFSAYLRADNYQTSSIGLYRPKLSLSCRNNKTALSFIAAEVLGTGTTTLKLGFDKPPNANVSWPSSEDYQSAKALQPLGLVRRFNTSNTLHIAYWPFGEDSAKTATFNLTSSDQVVNKVRSLCTW